jgi:hypothetical protein
MMKNEINNGDMDFFDTNFWIGENNLSEKYTTDDNSAIKAISQRAEKYNITSTLITHFNSLFCSPETGNDLLSCFLKKAKDFNHENAAKKSIRNAENSANGLKDTFCKGVLFMEFDYFKSPVIFKSQLKKRYAEGFRCIRLLPKSHKYPIEATLLKHVYQVLDDCRFPVMISIDELDITGDKYIEWMKILHIADSFSNMPVIIDGGNSKEMIFNSYIYLLIQNSSNIYFNTHNLFGLGQIENIASYGGSERLIFDSYFPFYETFLSVDRILEADLSGKEKRNIASLNMKKIIDNIEI